MKKIYILCFLAMWLTACFEDKGNYDYKNIYELNVGFEKWAHTISFGDTLRVEADLGRTAAPDTSRYSYSWTIDDESRPEWNSRILVWKVDKLIKDGHLSVHVKDNETGLIYSAQASLKVTGVYENDYSWMILSDNGGKSQLSYFSSLEYDEEKEKFVRTKFYEDVYTDANEGAELGTGPIALQEHYRKQVDYTETVIGNVCVFQQSGAVDLSGESFEKEINMKEAFDVYPEGVVLRPGTFMEWVDVMADQNGRLYSRMKSVSTVYNSERFLSIPLKCVGEETPLEKCQIAYGYYCSNRTGYNMVYDGGCKRLLYVFDGGNSWDADLAGAGKIDVLPAMGPNDKRNEIVPLDNMAGYELLNMQMFGYGQAPSGWDNYYGIFMCLREESSNKLYAQFVKYTGSGGEPEILEIKRYEIKGLPGLPNVATLSLYQPEYVFFAEGHDVYYFSINNPKQPVEKYYTFNSSVTALNAETVDGKFMGVGLENGEFYVLDIEGANNTVLEERVMYKSDVKVGRIVDVKYKQKSQWNY